MEEETEVVDLKDNVSTSYEKDSGMCFSFAIKSQLW